MSSLTLYEVAQAIADTVKQADPTGIETYPFVNPSAMGPAAMVTLETRLMDRESMDGQQYRWWRVWIIVPYNDADEAAQQLYAYLDDNGSKSIQVALKSATAAWRDVAGLADVSYYGWARMPGDIQGPMPVSFGGPEVWSMALLVEARYG